MKCSGIDLHSNNSVVVVSDEVDRVLVRRRVANDAAAILALLAAHREELVGVVVESTYNWYWLVDALQAAGYRVHLANTAAIKRYEGLKHSGDEDDAAYLAHWGSCRAVISVRRRRERCGIWRASACSWCGAARRRYCRWRTCCRARRGRECAAARYRG